jgi:hypothetical protein
MRWFRSHRRPSAWLALLALALQLGLAFGHVHAIHAETFANSVSSTQQPLSGDADDSYCATCSILAQLTTAQAASAPVAALPVLQASAEITVAPEGTRVDSWRVGFRSRAPPLS